MDDFDTRILVDAKEEYSKELVRVLKRYILEGINSLYNQACEICKKNRSKTIITFQDLLEQIPKWNQELIEKETTRIIENSKCEFFEDLITAVFVSHTKILAAIRTTKKNKRINLTIPKPETFIHKCYIESAREFWKSPYMLDKRVSNFEQQRNNKYCEEIISISIQETIRKLLPLKYILKESLGDTYEDEQSSDGEDITKSISKSDESNLKRLVQNEIKNHYSVKDSLNDDDNLNSLLSADIDSKIVDNVIEKENNEKKEKKETNEKKENNNEKNEVTNKKDSSENEVKDIKIQSGGNSLFSSANMKTDDSKLNSLNDDSKSININTTTPDSNPIDKISISSVENISDLSLDKSEKPEAPILNIPIESSNKLSSNDINVDSINNLDIDNGSGNNLNLGGDNDLNELDIGSLVVNDNSPVQLDGNYNMVDSDKLYNNLNNKSTIKEDVINDLSVNTIKDDSIRPNLFDDAPISD